MSKLRIGVLFGGRSGEHEVSLRSATSIIQAFDQTRYEIVPIGITKEGRWLVGGDPLAYLTDGKERTFAPIPVALLPDPMERSLVSLETGAVSGLGSAMQVDVVFPVLHGPYGEDGTIQGLLELAGIPYVGAGVLASAVGMDKAAMKAAFASAGLPQVEYVVVLRRDLEQDPVRVCQYIESELGFPCFVKPANLGSSVGISKVKGPEGLPRALAEAAEYDRKLVVEAAALDCREVEVSVLGNDEPLTSVVGEIVPAGEFYDYQSKYLDDRSQLIIPADLPAETAEYVRDLAAAAFKAIDCSGLARVDFFVHKTTGQVWINEINTMPGFTRTSMYPKLWEASGLPFSQLLDRLVELALDRHRDRQRSRHSYQG